MEQIKGNHFFSLTFSPVVTNVAQPRPDLRVDLDVLVVGHWVVERLIAGVAIKTERIKHMI